MHEGRAELLELRGDLLEARGDVLERAGGGDWTAPTDLLLDPREGEDTSFSDYVDLHGPCLVRLASATLADPAGAEQVVQRALAAAYRDWSGFCEAPDPHPEVLRVLCRLLPHDDPEEVPQPLGEQASPVRRVLWRMMPRERLAAALHHIAGLGEQEVAHVLRVRWLDAVALLARGEARGPELLADAGLALSLSEALDLLGRESQVPATLAARARSAAGRRTTRLVALAAVVLCGLGAAVVAAPDPVAPPPAAPTLFVVPGDRPTAAQPELPRSSRCPEQFRRPLADFAGGLVDFPLLAPRDLGTDWLQCGTVRTPGPPVAVLPTGGVVLPRRQSAAVNQVLETSSQRGRGLLRLEQTHLLYPGAGELAYDGIFAGLTGVDRRHESLLLTRRTGGEIEGAVFRYRRLPSIRRPDGQWVPRESHEVVVRRGDVVSIVRLTSARRYAMTPDAARLLLAAVADRLGRREPERVPL